MTGAVDIDSRIPRLDVDPFDERRGHRLFGQRSRCGKRPALGLDELVQLRRRRDARFYGGSAPVRQSSVGQSGQLGHLLRSQLRSRVTHCL